LSGVRIETAIETLILQMQHKGYACSVSNVIEAERKRNFELIPNLEKLYSLLKTEEIENYFLGNDVTALHLAKFLYTFNVLANNTLYNQHDGKKARDIVKTAKSLAEQYMRRTPDFPVDFNFDGLKDEDINLLIAKVNGDLLSIYTILIYFQGRSYIYENKELAEGKQYFDTCNKLGKKLNMFEGFLSIGRGILVLDLLAIENKAKGEKLTQEDRTAAIKQLEENLVELGKLKSDANAYIVGYKPGEDNKMTVTPSEDLYNLIDCSEQEIKHYNFLIDLTTDEAKLRECVEKVRSIFADIFKLLNENQKINPRKKTSIYNTLGFILLSGYDKHQDLTGFRSEITKALGDSLLVKPTLSDLLFIKAIFRLAKPKRDGEMEFTGAETYDGLSKVNERLLLKLDDSQEFEYDAICDSLVMCRNKRDEINEKLKRNKN
jgi:hypothetical protein